ncbi:MAG: CapA family protein [Desulfitobacterium hafniense]|nr:CapA family protein [Desulfitobacterium hafniense]
MSILIILVRVCDKILVSYVSNKRREIFIKQLFCHRPTNRYLSLIWLIVIVVFLLAGCSIQSTTAVVVEEPKQSPPPPLPRKETVTLTAAGDILMHNTQIWSGQQKDGTYKFNFFEPVKELLEQGDYCSTNFEAALAGPESGYTGYPLFNSPDAMADTLKDAGFDLVIGANNHILDRGYKGALRTLEILKNAGLDTTGAFRNQEEQKTFLIKEFRGVKVGYLAYTYGTNGIPVSKEHAYLINFLDKAKVLSDISALRPQVDVVMLVLHWGVEYSPQPTNEQKKLAREFLEAGADVLLGSHPHVIEPMEVLRVGDKDKFVIYSMGNFVGDQRGVERNSGVVLKLQFQKDFNTGTTKLKEVFYTPTYSHSYNENGRQKFRVVPLEETIQKVKDKKDPYLTEKELPVLEQALAQTKKTLGPGFISNNNTVP